jgi:hypothetical protein
MSKFALLMGFNPPVLTIEPEKPLMYFATIAQTFYV